MRREMVKELTADWNRLHALLSESYGYWYDKLKRKSIPKRRAFFKNILPSMLSARTKEERKVFLLPHPGRKGDLLSQKPWASKIYLESLEWQIRFLLEKIELLEGKKRELGKRLSSISKKMQKLNSSIYSRSWSS